MYFYNRFLIPFVVPWLLLFLYLTFISIAAFFCPRLLPITLLSFVHLTRINAIILFISLRYNYNKYKSVTSLVESLEVTWSQKIQNSRVGQGKKSKANRMPSRKTSTEIMKNSKSIPKINSISLFRPID